MVLLISPLARKIVTGAPITSAPVMPRKSSRRVNRHVLMLLAKLDCESVRSDAALAGASAVWTTIALRSARTRSLLRGLLATTGACCSGAGSAITENGLCFVHDDSPGRVGKDTVPIYGTVIMPA